MIHRPLQIVITFKTLLLAVALLLLTWAVVSIRDTLLVVFVGIFLGLVFEGPVRLVERKTRLGRGMSATVTVIGALVVVTLLGLVLLKPLLEGMQSFLRYSPGRKPSPAHHRHSRLSHPRRACIKAGAARPAYLGVQRGFALP